MPSLPEELARLCRERDLKIAVAESLTSGLLASSVGSGPDADEWFCGGIIAYRREVKERVLGVRYGIDPCSAPCAEQLARGARELLRADLAVSTTGVGGPGSEGGHGPGTVYLGWSSPAGEGARYLRLQGPVEAVLQQTVHHALLLLLHQADHAAA